MSKNNLLAVVYMQLPIAVINFVAATAHTHVTVRLWKSLVTCWTHNCRKFYQIMVKFISHYFMTWLQCTRFYWIIHFCYHSLYYCRNIPRLVCLRAYSLVWLKVMNFVALEGLKWLGWWSLSKILSHWPTDHAKWHGIWFTEIDREMALPWCTHRAASLRI